MVSGNHQLLVKPLAASWVPESHCCHPSGTYKSLEGERSDAQHGVRPCAAGVGSAGEGLGNSSRDCIFEIAVLVCICRLPAPLGIVPLPSSSSASEIISSGTK